MKRIFVFLIIALLSPSCSINHEPEYYLTSYSAIFEPAENTNSVRVTLKMEYHVTGGVKSDGFKFIGNCDVTDISAEDGGGNPLHIMLIQQGGNRLEWNFNNPVSYGYQKVTVRFVLHNFLQRQDDVNLLKAEWAGAFKIDVKNSEYVIIFPDRQKPFIVDCTPSDYLIEKKSGKWHLAANQKELVEKAFIVSYDTKIQHSGAAINKQKTADAFFGKKIFNYFLPWMPLAVSFLVFGIILKYFFNRKAKDGYNHKSHNSNRDGGSCSGGGCGGGGCGGGCGS